MAWSFNLANGMVLQTTISSRQFDQLVVNVFDILIDNVSVAVTSDTLLSSIESLWSTWIPIIQTDELTHVQTKVQVVTDCIESPTNPGTYKRVYGVMDRKGHTAAMDGSVASAAIPFDTTGSVQLITNGAPGPFWGRKSIGGMTVDSIDADGETLDAVYKAALDAGMQAVFIPANLISTGPATWTCVVLPTTYVGRQALPHSAMSVYAKDIIAVDVGTYTGSQKTRQIRPNSLLAH